MTTISLKAGIQWFLPFFYQRKKSNNKKGKNQRSSNPYKPDFKSTLNHISQVRRNKILALFKIYEKLTYSSFKTTIKSYQNK